ncbi:mannose-6-phosphate isomerase, class I [Pseudoclavibacter sp. CFCC 11306]|uniref:mannose-6-phosphate isomerase, class I n=1 Tax=Pseudoclavibacter sp. CFCC 11306 TaxID=1564493 RepID=UPI00130147AF|nr:mannose-6-phosphate isomerase, class I [Pseudoclavibacter sp. CFCC 11306]KAB1658888.1 mannose-6-phosphate isomerase, class I [Pseudoclavibacter sp. CFCC 11306]
MSLLIDNEPRDYDWGTPGGIARLRGVPSRRFHSAGAFVASEVSAKTSASAADSSVPMPAEAEPEAELWLGTHPTWPSVVVDGPYEGETLPEALRQLGRPAEIGYLFKLLSVDRPLSVQVHPDADQANEGFVLENAMNVPLKAAVRNYRDPNAKPEMVYALSESFDLLAGFRDPEAVIADVELILRSCQSRTEEIIWLELLHALVEDDPIEAAVRWMLQDDAVFGRALANQMHTRFTGGFGVCANERDEVLRRLDEHYPGDRGVPFGLLLRHETLERGQSIYLRPRTPHCYLHGTGLELMGPSDNVLRAGLTSKHVDDHEFLKVLDFEPSAPKHLYEYHKNDVVEVQAEGAGLRLTFTHVSDGQRARVPFHDGDIAYVMHHHGDGRLLIRDADGAHLTVGEGQAAVLVDARELHIVAPEQGHATVVVAGRDS